MFARAVLYRRRFARAVLYRRKIARAVLYRRVFARVGKTISAGHRAAAVGDAFSAGHWAAAVGTAVSARGEVKTIRAKQSLQLNKDTRGLTAHGGTRFR